MEVIDPADGIIHDPPEQVPTTKGVPPKVKLKETEAEVDDDAAIVPRDTFPKSIFQALCPAVDTRPAADVTAPMVATNPAALEVLMAPPALIAPPTPTPPVTMTAPVKKKENNY